MGEALRHRFSAADLVRLASSLILALLLWGWVTTREDPETTRVFANVPIQVGELPGSLVVVSAVPNALVQLSGPRSVINALTSAEISAHLDLDGIDRPGEYAVPVVVSTPSGVWKRRVTPSRLSIQVEESMTRQFPVVPVEAGTTDTTRQIGQVRPEVSTVTVSGPKSAVERVDRVILPIDIGDQSRDFSTSIAPVAQDRDGQAVTEVTLLPASIETTVEIVARGKSVAVLAQLVGSPAGGLDVLNWAVNPATVLVEGPREVLDGLVAVQTQPIDVSGATENFSRRVGLIGLPPEVHVIEPPDGQVQIFVQVGQRGVRQPLPGQRVEVINLAPGLEADLNPPEVTVVVVASAEILGRLTADDLTIQVDLVGYGPGQYTLRPTVSLPPNVQWISTEPATIQVTIRAVSGTPAPATPPAASRD